MEKKELVAMLIESPFYFDILLGERLVIVQQHRQRFLGKTMLNKSIDSKKVTDSTVVDERDVGKVTTIIRGYIPPSIRPELSPRQPQSAVNPRMLPAVPPGGSGTRPAS